MILIADGGSTKVDWAILYNNKTLLKFNTLGLNPNISSIEEISNSLNESSGISLYKDDISELYFYGAGCSTQKSEKILQDIFKKVFKNSTIIIKEDTVGAVYACSKEESLVAIIGTGSNSCYYDGINIKSNIPSLGYIVMDDASGNYFGKELLRDFFYKKMPKELQEKFSDEFNLSPDAIIDNLYLKEKPNMYLANFAKFMANHKESSYIKKLIYNGFTIFFENWIIPFSKNKKLPIYFVGSIAYFFQNILHEIGNENNLIIKNIIKKPIDNLINYHLKELDTTKNTLSNRTKSKQINCP